MASWEFHLISQATLTLSQMLKEMDQAIGDELSYIKQHQYSQTKYTAIDGQIISEQGSYNIYQFILETPWEPQDDTPVKVVFAETQEFKATIVTSTGTIITISTEEPLPQKALDKIYLIDDSTILLERLREALKNNEEGSSEVGSKCFSLKPSTQLQTLSQVDFGEKFNPDVSQVEAIQMALRNETTYIIGPPGTGKTSTLAAIAFAYLRAGKSVLIAAQTNIAVDNAIMRLVDICKNAIVQNKEALFDLNNDRIIRYGTPQLKRFKTEYREVHLPSIVERRAEHLNQQYKEMQGRHDSNIIQLEQLRQEQQQQSPAWQQKKASLIAKQQHLNKELQELIAREEQRVTNLKKQLDRYNIVKAETERDLFSVLQDFKLLKLQQDQLKIALGTLTTKANDLIMKLSTAQQMNPVIRILNGINTDAIDNELANIPLKIEQNNQQLNAIQNQMSERYFQCSSLEQQIQQYLINCQTIEKQLSTPTSDRQKIEYLQKLIEQTKLDIVQQEAQYKQEQLEIVQKQRILNDEVTKIKEQMVDSEKQLSDIEKNIIDEAKVIGTTLSKVYMRSNLRERQFDVVIIDEVSMASLPAVYIAASRANRSVVTIGDPNQLAPIYQSQNELVKKWLGTDLFSEIGISFDAATKGNDHSVLLNEQSRMHPTISNVASKHVYQGRIKDSTRVYNTEYSQYSKVSPLPSKQLVLCDTSDASPIATRPKGKSRINIYHALCIIEIARQVLASLPNSEKELQPGEFRVGLVTPYSKQAQLLQSIVKDAGLAKVVRAGTVHKFQGLEADVIIFDTVDSSGTEPTEFVNGIYGSDAMRLINVAVTRAKHKLIIVANLKYVTNKFSSRSILRLAVEDAKSVGVINSRSVLSNLLPVQNAKIFETGKRDLLKTAKSSEDSYYVPIFLDDRSFFDHFKRDLQEAKSEIIIFSPFIRLQRTKEITPILLEKLKRGVNIVVVASQSNSGNEIDNSALKLLKDAGIKVQTSLGLHEKLIFIDKKIVYAGSLNALSHNGTTEFMERVKSSDFVEQIWEFKQLNSSVVTPAKWGTEIEIEHLFDLPRLISACKNCGSDMVSRMGKYGVFYSCPNWRNCGQKGEDISEIHLKDVKKLTNIRCSNCDSHAIMHIKTHRKDTWLECTDCNYRRKIIII